MGQIELFNHLVSVIISLFETIEMYVDCLYLIGILNK